MTRVRTPLLDAVLRPLQRRIRPSPVIGPLSPKDPRPRMAVAHLAAVSAALVIMAAFFSTIMTLLFKMRDRVLSWQKGVIKW